MRTHNSHRPTSQHAAARAHHGSAHHPSHHAAPRDHGDSFTTETLNIKSNPQMKQSAVVHDVRKAAQQSGLIGFQEIAPKRYLKAIRQTLGKDWGVYAPHDKGGMQIEDPIAWKKSEWKLEDSGFKRTHHGLAKVSPNRYITWVKLKNRATGKEIVRINTHLVSGAFTKGKSHHDWRVHAYDEHIAALQKMVKHFEAQGLPVIVGGDFNNSHKKVMGNAMKYDNNIHVGTHGKATFDYLMSSKGDGFESTGGHVVHGFASDHDAVVAGYSLANVGEPKKHKHHG